MYTAKVNSTQTLLLDKSANLQDAHPQLSEIHQATDTSITATIDGETVTAFVTAIDEDTNDFTIKIKHNTYQVNLQTPADELVKKLGIVLAKSKKASSLLSPMPGLIIKLLVAEGDKVRKGDNLLILEAMKMENVFKASTDAVVKEIAVQAGQVVEKGQSLIIFE
jgi:biotin carboxyl carrier protein